MICFDLPVYIVLGEFLEMIRALVVLLSLSALVPASELKVNDRDYLEARGLSVLVYQNVFHPVFRDQKLSAIEIILDDNRIATDGDVRATFWRRMRRMRWRSESESSEAFRHFAEVCDSKPKSDLLPSKRVCRRGC